MGSDLQAVEDHETGAGVVADRPAVFDPDVGEGGAVGGGQEKADALARSEVYLAERQSRSGRRGVGLDDGDGEVPLDATGEVVSVAAFEPAGVNAGGQVRRVNFNSETPAVVDEEEELGVGDPGLVGGQGDLALHLELRPGVLHLGADVVVAELGVDVDGEDLLLVAFFELAEVDALGSRGPVDGDIIADVFLLDVLELLDPLEGLRRIEGSLVLLI